MAFEGIESKVAIVTGGGGGIGEAYARGFAAEGGKVVVAELDKEGGERVADAINADGGQAVFVHTDIGSEESTQQAAAAAIDAFAAADFFATAATYALPSKVRPALPVAGHRSSTVFAPKRKSTALVSGLRPARSCARRPVSTACWFGSTRTGPTPNSSTR